VHPLTLTLLHSHPHPCNPISDTNHISLTESRSFIPDRSIRPNMTSLPSGDPCVQWCSALLLTMQGAQCKYCCHAVLRQHTKRDSNLEGGNSIKCLYAGVDSEWNVIHGYSYHSYNKAGPRMVEEVATLREKLTV